MPDAPQQNYNAAMTYHSNLKSLVYVFCVFLVHLFCFDITIGNINQVVPCLFLNAPLDYVHKRQKTKLAL